MSDDNIEPTSKLNEFLKDWDEKKPDEGNKELLAKVAEQGDQIKELLKTTGDHNEALKAEAYKEDIKPVIATVKGEEKASDKTVHNWLNGEADENPKLRATWDDREKNPEAFDKMIEALAPKFKEYIQGESKNVLDIKDDSKDDKDDKDGKDDKDDSKDDTDLLALAHAYRIARNSNAVATDDYEKVEWSGLSEPEFARMSQKVFEDMKSGKLKPEKAA